jgi:hypothetical protein
MCACNCRKGAHEQQKGEERYKDQMEKVSLLNPSPCKPTMVVEVCAIARNS